MKRMSDKGGYSVVMVPIVLSIVLSLVALVFDFSRVFVLKHQLQTAADAAALAGASMVKVEFAKDIQDNFDFNNTTITLVSDKAVREADACFQRNIAELNLDKVLTLPLEKNAIVKDDYTFEYRIKAQIPVTMAAIFLGHGGIQSITVIAEAQTSDR